MKDGRTCLLEILLVAVAVLTGGCSRENSAPAIESVPDSAVTVKTVDMAFLLESAGWRPSASGAPLTGPARQVVDLVVESEQREAFMAVASDGGAVDLSHVTSFTTARGEKMIVMPLSDETLLLKSLFHDDKVPPRSKDGFIFAELGGQTVASDGKRCWIAPGRRELLSAMEEAARSHFGTLIGVRNFLESPAVAKIALNCGRSPLSFLGGSSRWLCVEFNVSDAAVSAQAKVMDRDGAIDSIGRNFKDIDTDFLRYTPGDAAVVLAFGKFSGNERGLAMLLGRYAPVYLSQADGTTSLYAVPAGGVAAVAAATPGSWNVETMVHLPGNLLAQGLEQYKERAGTGLVRLDGQWSYAEGDNRYYFGAFDGSLVFSTNREISADYNNGFTDDFLGHKAAMIVDIPAGSVLSKAWELPYGLTFRLAVDAMTVKGRIVFHGSGNNALVSLLRMPQLPDFNERFRAHTGQEG